MLTTEKTYQSILRKLSRVSVEALPQIDLYLQHFLVEKKAAKKMPMALVMELPSSQPVNDEDVLRVWADRPESASEIAHQVRARNRRTK